MISPAHHWRFMLRFAMAGLLTFLLDTAVFLLLALEAGVPVWLANIVAWAIAVQQSYVLNGVWTFRRPWRELADRVTYGGFIVGGLLGVTVTTVTVTLAAMVMPVLPAKGLAILTGVAFNYIASHFVFHARLKRFGGGEVPG
jgi:putative flippase GtrA